MKKFNKEQLKKEVVTAISSNKEELIKAIEKAYVQMQGYRKNYLAEVNINLDDSEFYSTGAMSPAVKYESKDDSYYEYLTVVSVHGWDVTDFYDMTDSQVEEFTDVFRNEDLPEIIENHIKDFLDKGLENELNKRFA